MSAGEKTLSPHDYLQLERAAEFKSEYHRGTITLKAVRRAIIIALMKAFLLRLALDSKEKNANLSRETFVFGFLMKNFIRILI